MSNFISDLSGLTVIDGSNFHGHVPPSREPDEGGYGYIPRDWQAEPYGSLEYMPAFENSSIKLLEYDEIDERIEELERTKTRISDLCLSAGLPKSTQNGLNYCWGYGVVNAVKIWRCLMGLPYLALSAESMCAPIKGGSNSGGWVGEAVKWITTKGVTTEDKWPQHSRNTRNLTPEVQADALNLRVTGFYDLPRQDIMRVALSAVVQRKPIPVGYDWWRHVVTLCDAVKTGVRQYGFRIFNSHNDGFSKVLTGSRAVPDDGTVIETVTAA